MMTKFKFLELLVVVGALFTNVAAQDSISDQMQSVDDELQLPSADLDFIPDPLVEDGASSEIPIISSGESGPLIFKVTQRVVVQDGEAVKSFEQNSHITLRRRGSIVTMSVGNGLDVDFSIFDDDGYLVEAGESGNALKEAIRAARAAGTRMEQLVFTDSTMMIVATGFRSKDVTITYAERIKPKGLARR